MKCRHAQSMAISLVLLIALADRLVAQSPTAPSPSPSTPLRHGDIAPQVLGSDLSDQAGLSEISPAVPAVEVAPESKPVETQSNAGSEGDKPVMRRESPAGTEHMGERDRTVGSRKDEGGLFADMLPLLIVLAVIGGIALIIKRYTPARRLLGGAGVLEVVARLPLSSKQTVVLVRMGGRMVLVGVSPERINALCVVDDPEQVAQLIGEAASRLPDSISREFADALGGEAHAYVGTELDEDEGDVEGGHVRGLLEKVRRMTQTPGT